MDPPRGCMALEEATARKEFFGRARRDGESREQYADALRNLLDRCQFGEQTEMLFHMRFSCEFPDELEQQIVMTVELGARGDQTNVLAAESAKGPEVIKPETKEPDTTRLEPELEEQAANEQDREVTDAIGNGPKPEDTDGTGQALNEPHIPSNSCLTTRKNPAQQTGNSGGRRVTGKAQNSPELQNEEEAGQLPEDGDGKDRYKKTTGAATGAGENYEWKMLMLVCLRLHATGFEFQLASNMEAAGKFDDIVLRHRTHPDQQWNVSYVQLKHKQSKGKFISKPDLLGLGSGDFSLVKYCDSYENMKSTKEFKSFCDVEYKINIFTNASIDSGLVVEVESDPLLHTGGKTVSLTANGKVYRELCEWVDFKEVITALRDEVDGKSDVEVGIKIEEALSCVKQYDNKITNSYKHQLLGNPTLKKLEEIAKCLAPVRSKATFASFLATLRLNTNQTRESKLDEIIKQEINRVFGCKKDDNLFHVLRDGVHDWWQNKSFFLDNDSVLWHDVVKSRKDKLSLSSMDKLAVDGFEFAESCLQAMHQGIPSKGVVNVRVVSKTAASLLKVSQVLAKFGSAKNVLFVNTKALLEKESEDDVIDAWAALWCRVLVVECDSGMDQTQADHFRTKISNVIGRKDNDKLLVLIAAENHKLNELLRKTESYTHLVDKFHWDDVTPATKDKILQEKVDVQGSKLTLSKLLAGDVDKLFSEPDGLEIISQLLVGANSCGKALYDEDKSFVQRRIKLNLKRPFVVNSVYDVHGKVALVVAEPGMGKSTLMTHLAKQTKAKNPTAWIVHLKLNDCAEHLSTVDSSKVNKDVAKTFVEHFALSGGNILERSLFRSLEHNFMVFVDGVDEVSPSYEKQIFKLLSVLKDFKFAKLWVASRSVFETRLEEVLGTKAYHLDHFSKDEQEEFFNKEWKKKFPGESSKKRPKATGSLMAFLSQSFGADNLVLGIPLIAAMLADMFEEQALAVIQGTGSFETKESLNLMSLYKTFVNEKFDRYFDEKRKMTAENRKIAAAVEEEAKTKEGIYRSHRLAALRVLFSLEEIAGLQFEGKEKFESKLKDYLKEVSEGREKVGIIVNLDSETPHFIHHSFAEYFASSWLALNYKDNPEFTKQILFDPAYKTLSFMFHCALAEKHPLHVAVLNRDVNETERLLNAKCDVNELDEGGRTAVHLAVLLSGTEPHEDFVTIAAILIQRSRTDTVDSILKWNVLQYAERARAWRALQMLVKKAKRADKMTKDAKIPDVGTMLDAARDASVSVVRYLSKDRGGKLKCSGSKGETMIHMAAEGGNVDVLEYLVAEKLSLYDEDKRKYTALHYATFHDKVAAVKYLLREGLDIAAVNGKGITVLQEAALHGAYKVMAVLTKQIASQKNAKPGKLSPDQRKASLFCAAFSGDLESVKHLVSMGADRYQKDDKGHTAAWLAMTRGNFGVMDLLLLRESDDGDTPLHGACRSGESEIVAYLVSQARAQTDQSMPPEGKPGTVTEKSDEWTGLECRNNDGKTPLHVASKTGRSQVVELLLSLGANADATDAEGWTPLHVASWRGQLDAMDALIENGAAVDFRDNDGKTAMHKAATWGRKQGVELLLRHGAEILAADDKGWTALHDAMKGNKAEVVAFLFEKGELLEQAGITPLMAAAVRGLAEVKNLLKNFDAENNGMSLQQYINLVDKQGWNAIHFAACFGFADVIAFLVGQGGATKSCDRDKMTPLHSAALYKHPGAVKALLAALDEADRASVVNSCAVDGDSVLVHAVRGDCLECVELLVQAGTKVSQAGRNGETPLLAAAREGHTKVVECLLSNFDEEREGSGMSLAHYVNMADENGRTAIHCPKGSRLFGFKYQVRLLECVKLLVQAGAMFSIADSDGRTPLMAAASEGHRKVVEFLLEEFDEGREGMSKKDYVNAVDGDGKSALDVAERECSVAIKSFR